MLETNSALGSLYGGQITFSTPFRKPNNNFIHNYVSRFNVDYVFTVNILCKYWTPLKAVPLNWTFPF